MDLQSSFQARGISFEEAFDALDDGIVVVCANFDLLYCNSAARKICELPIEENFSKWTSSTGIFQSNKTNPHLSEELPVSRALNGETVKNHHLFFQDEKMQKGKLITCNAKPVFKDQVVIAAIITFRDITELDERDEEMRRERLIYQQLLDIIPAFIFSKDLKGQFTYFNKKFKSTFQSMDLMSTSRDYLSARSSEEVRIKDELVIEQKRSIEFEEEYLDHKTNQTSHFRTTRIPMIDTQGRVYGISAISFDITDEVERMKSLEQDRLHMASASRLAALGMMAAEIGHEINNPLAVIRTSSWILRKLMTAKEIAQDLVLKKLDDIDATIERINETVGSLRNLSRESVHEEPQQHLVRDIIKDVQGLCRPRITPKGIELSLDEKNPLLSAKILCRRVQLSEVLVNLLVNAVDEVEKLEHPKIKIEILSDSDHIIFRVTDNGSGVPLELEHKIFHPFFSTKEVGKGTGLGLSISRGIMKRQGGELILNRSVSNSCFDVILPYKANVPVP